jgi:hypothetical protein
MSTWRPCSACKKPIVLGGRYWTCSVSTCNRARFELVFCSVACWDAHVPGMNHRNAWCTEHRAPLAPDAPPPVETVRYGAPAKAEEPARRIARPNDTPPEAEEILIVASRLKQYIKDRADMNTSADVLEALSDIVRDRTEDAIRHARAEGRKTVMARDYR